MVSQLARCLLLGSMLLAGCNGDDAMPAANSLQQLQNSGVLHVITRNTPATYFQDKNGDSGFEYELVRRLADQLNLELKMETVDNIEQIYQRIQQKNGPLLMAAGLSGDQLQAPATVFSNGYLEVTPQVIYNSNQTRPKSAAELIGKNILVVKGSIHENRLLELQQELPELEFSSSDQVEATDLLSMLDEGKIDITMVNSSELALNQVYFPHIQLAFSMRPPAELRWGINHHHVQKDTSLIDYINEFLQQQQDDGVIDKLTERYFGHVDTLGYVGANAFAKHLQQRLPKYEPAFKRSAERFGLDWRLLAATAYQESHWDPLARSRTGVRGIMMLTLPTAEEVGVTNRLDPVQSIRGGAQYLSQIFSRLPDDIHEQDRTWFALAAYNVGFGHMLDARMLAEQAGLNPGSWADVRSVLPRLAEKKWYSQTRYGYARGGEPVHYVNNIRRYYDILTWVTQPQLEGDELDEPMLHTPGINQ